MRSNQWSMALRKELREILIEVCDRKIDQKGSEVGLSFYAFFKNKNDQPEVLMEVARWWIETHELDHFEKAVKIRDMVKSGA
ncbi:DUF6500 family protein [Vreelandella venusta]|uniref:DUF6500 family protein n=2 Tax=Vreelandella venusta TaxID=44935 RepID=UPI002E1A86D1